jgi:4-amino-4-deoxy-L-arabinose transferase-like glycosyltransferase
MVLLALCGLAFFFRLGDSAIADLDEAFYAEAGREMIERGDWITPHYNDRVRLYKPILFYWLVALSYKVLGVTETAARVVSACSGLGLVFIAYGVGRRWIGPSAGLLAGAMAATCFGMGWMARQSLPDLPLAFFMTLGTWCAIEALTPGVAHARRWLLLAAVAVALGVLTKGPIALAVPAVVLAPLVWWEHWTARREDASSGRLRRGRARRIGVMHVAGPWYLLAEHANRHVGTVRSRQNLARFAAPRFNEPQGLVCYVPVWWHCSRRGRLHAWVAHWRLVRTRRSLSRVEARLICWAGAPLLLLSLSIGKQPRYILPCLVPIILALARSICRGAFDRSSARSPMLVVAGVAAGLMLIQVGVGVWQGRHVLATIDAGWSVTPVVCILIAGGLVVLTAVLAWRWLPAVMAVASTITWLAFHDAVRLSGRPEPVEIVASVVRADPPDILCACGVFHRNLAFYSQRRIISVSTLDRIQAVLDSPTVVYAVVDSVMLDKIESMAGRRYTHALEVPYLSATSIGVSRLLGPRLPREVQRVILVRNR